MATKGKGDVRYLQPINVESGNQKEILSFQESQVLSTLTTRIQITCCVL